MEKTTRVLRVTVEMKDGVTFLIDGGVKVIKKPKNLKGEEYGVSVEKDLPEIVKIKGCVDRPR